MEMKKLIVVGIIFLFIGVAVAPGINSSVVKTSDDNDHKRTQFLNNAPLALPFIIRFNSYIKIEYDGQYVNHSFIRDIAYAIPVNIGYRADVPSVLLHSNFWLSQLVKNWILFRSFIAPSATINVSTENVPSWAEIYPSTPNILMPVDNEWVIASFVVVVIIHSQAPSGPFAFTVNTVAPAFHRINGYLNSINITITVQ